MFQRSTIEKSFRTSLIVMLLSELTSTIGPLIDGIIIAAFLGKNGVAEFGVINPLLIAYNALGSVFATGAVTFCSQLIGKGKTDKAAGAFSAAFFFIVITSVVTTAVLLAFADPITRLLGASPTAADNFFIEAKNYYIGITVSFPAFNLMIYLTSFMQVDNDRKRALIATIVLTVTDVIGDILSATVFKSGMFGMGLATSVANYFALIVLLFHFAKKDAMMKPRLKKLPWNLIGAMVPKGIVSFVTLIGTTLMFILMNHILIAYGGDIIVLTAFTVQRQVFTFLFALGKSMGFTVMTMVGFFYGERNTDDLRELLFLGIKYTILLGGAVAVIGITFADILASLFVSSNPEAVPLVAWAVRIIVLCIPFITANILYECFYRGSGRLFPSITLSILIDFLLSTIIAYVLAPFIGEKSVFWAHFSAQVLILAATVAVVWIRCQKKDRPFIEMALFLPAQFKIDPERHLFEYVKDIPGCSKIAGQILELGTRLGIERRKTVFAALCSEEMCENILEHDFDGRKDNMISVFTFVDEKNQMLISIRDNCKPFSPVEWDKIHNNDEDNIKYIGIRLVAKLAKEIRYTNALNMNSLYISF